MGGGTSHISFLVLFFFDVRIYYRISRSEKNTNEKKSRIVLRGAVKSKPTVRV